MVAVLRPYDGPPAEAAAQTVDMTDGVVDMTGGGWGGGRGGGGGGERSPLHAANVGYPPTWRPESPRVVVN